MTQSPVDYWDPYGWCLERTTYGTLSENGEFSVGEYCGDRSIPDILEENYRYENLPPTSQGPYIATNNMGIIREVSRDFDIYDFALAFGISDQANQPLGNSTVDGEFSVIEKIQKALPPISGRVPVFGGSTGCDASVSIAELICKEGVEAKVGNNLNANELRIMTELARVYPDRVSYDPNQEFYTSIYSADDFRNHEVAITIMAAKISGSNVIIDEWLAQNPTIRIPNEMRLIMQAFAQNDGTTPGVQLREVLEDYANTGGNNVELLWDLYASELQSEENNLRDAHMRKLLLLRDYFLPQLVDNGWRLPDGMTISSLTRAIDRCLGH